ncbi:MAG: hypothetical protein ACTSXF_07410, partial [Promethearchaeota archaeon]
MDAPKKRLKIYDAVMKSIFDKAAAKIFKELGIDVRSETLRPLEMPELSPKLISDLLYKAIINGKEMLLHVEFQTRNHTKMLQRMGEYFFRILREYGNNYLLVQYLIYIGNEKLTMKNR